VTESFNQAFAHRRHLIDVATTTIKLAIVH
jgi:hypothetical protein